MVKTEIWRVTLCCWGVEQTTHEIQWYIIMMTALSWMSIVQTVFSWASPILPVCHVFTSTFSETSNLWYPHYKESNSERIRCTTFYTIQHHSTPPIVSRECLLMYYDSMILWLYDCTILWLYDCMILWLYDSMILWFYSMCYVYCVQYMWRDNTLVRWSDFDVSVPVASEQVGFPSYILQVLHVFRQLSLAVVESIPTVLQADASPSATNLLIFLHRL